MANLTRVEYYRRQSRRLNFTREIFTMVTAKEQITEVIRRQPDDSPFAEILRELVFALMVQRGLKDSDEGRTISNEDMHHRIRTWRKQVGSRQVKPRNLR
jgi:hypothetical protein